MICGSVSAAGRYGDAGWRARRVAGLATCLNGCAIDASGRMLGDDRKQLLVLVSRQVLPLFGAAVPAREARATEADGDERVRLNVIDARSTDRRHTERYGLPLRRRQLRDRRVELLSQPLGVDAVIRVLEGTVDRAPAWHSKLTPRILAHSPRTMMLTPEIPRDPEHACASSVRRV
jgi:hypothetical protein